MASLVVDNEEVLKAMLRDAARQGAEEALRRIGLDDEHAHHDIHEIRSLLQAWRVARNEMWRSTIHWITIITLGIIAIYVGAKLGLKLPQISGPS